MARYSLVKISDSRVETPVVVDGVLEAKTDLAVIDRFTSQFNKEKLSKELKLEEGSKLYIKYRNNNEYKYLPILTKEHEKFLIFTKNGLKLNENEEREYQDSFATYLSRLIKFIKDYSEYKYIDYLVEHKYITQHVRDRIYEYIAAEYMKKLNLKDLDDKVPNQVEIKTSLEKHLGSYRQLRDWYFGTKDFLHGEEKINGRLSASEYPTSYEEAYHQCTIEETVKSLNLTK